MLVAYLMILLVIYSVLQCAHYVKGGATYWGWEDFWIGVIGRVFIIGILIGGLCTGLSFLIKNESVGEWRVDETIQMVALADHSSQAGEFFLGCGTNEGTMVYVYYSDEGNGVYRFHSVDARYAEVHEVEGVDPYAETLGRHFRTRCGDHLLWQSIIADYYVFYIPPGTLQQTIVLDLQ